MDKQTVEQRAATLLAPIPGDNPGGENANYDPRHEDLRREVAKIESPTTGMPEWAHVAKVGGELLAGTSKDFLMAAYVAWAWFETEGLDGLACGVALLHGMVEKFWDAGFPPRKRIRGRGNAYGWFMSRFENAVGDIQVAAKDRVAIAILETSAPAFAALVREKFEDHAPGMRSLTDGIKRLAMSLPPASPEEQAALDAALAGGGADAPAAPAEAKAEPPPPSEAAPAEAPTEAKPAEPPPAEAKPAEPAPAEPAPVEAPAEPPPTEAKPEPPAEAKPAEPPPQAAPAEAKPEPPAEAKPAEPPPQAAPAEAKPEPPPAPEPPPEPEQPQSEWTPRVAKWLEPISADKPAGEDTRYDMEHSEVRSEVEKLESVTAGPPDWLMIRRTSDKLLREKSKDLTLASYLARALYELDGLDGLVTGLALIAELSERFWDGMYPPKKKERRRANAISWLFDPVERVLSDLQPTAKDARAIYDLDKVSKHLFGVIGQKFEKHSPGTRGLRDALTRAKMSAPEPPPEPKPEPAQASAPAQGGGAQPAAAQASAPAPAQAAPAEADKPAFDPAELAKKWIEPISADKPAGEDARYESEHEAVRNEVGKLESVTGGEVDWAAVKRDATTVLTQKSKDLLIAAYLARALHVEGGFRGLIQGMALLSELCERYWDDMQPPKKKERRRANAASWLIDQLEREIGEYKPEAKDAEDIELLEQANKHMLSVFGQKFEKHAPGTRGLRDAITRLKMSVPKPEPKPQPKPEPKPQPQAAPTPAPTPAAAPAAAPVAAPATQAAPQDAEQVLDYLRKVGTDFVKTSNVLRRANVADPLPYRLMRIGLYLHIAKPPPAQPTGNTMVPPPQADLVKRLGLMKANGKWPEIIEECEGSLMRFRFSMDLHHLTALALGNLGHGDARDAVIDGVRSLIGRMPTILALNFNNSDAFVGPDAKAWIDDEVFADEGGGGGGGGPGGLPEEAQEVIAKAKKAASGGKFGEAAEAMQTLIDTAGNARNRFLARLALAEMSGGGAPRVALGLFSGLAREAESLGIDQWEPELAARCLQGLVRAQAEAAKVKPPLTTDPAFERLCRINPEAASRMS
jgi:type VI secretion system ImpA/VasJ family protein